MRPGSAAVCDAGWKVPADFAHLLEASREATNEFEDILAAGAVPEELSTSLVFVNSSCKDCHVKYRDNR